VTSYDADSATVSGVGLAALLRRRRRERPDGVVVHFDRDWTADALGALADRIAARLVMLGVGRGDRVGVMLPNEVWWPSSLAAISRIGAVVVPVNHGYRPADLRHVLADSGARLLLVSRLAADVAGEVVAAIEHEIVVVSFDPDCSPSVVDWSTVADDPEPGDLGPWPGADDLCSLQYTSGTTGFPKACMLTHGYWTEVGQVAVQHASLGPDDVILAAAPFSYMDPQWNLMAAVLSGCSLVVLPRFSPSTFWQTVRTHGVTWCYLVGTMPVFLANLPASPNDTVHSLRFVTCSGIVPALHRTFEERWGAPWREAYGMTETGVDLACSFADERWVGTGHLGDPVPGKEVRLVGPDGVVDGIGDGELQVRGTPMMLGYWNRPADEQIIDAEGWLRTGDLVSRNAHGVLRLTGRLKDMIRRAGENIAAAEVEAVLVGHPAVAAAAVVGVPDPTRGEEVKAFVITSSGDVTAREIHDFAAAHLAIFKVPRFIEFVDNFPVTSSERVAKHLLVHGDTWDRLSPGTSEEVADGTPRRSVRSPGLKTGSGDDLRNHETRSSSDSSFDSAPGGRVGDG
jgi:acyl-CoA synthetase (AMP-forming)/AMP-acid ligase II